MRAMTVLAGSLDSPGSYVHLGPLEISVANLVVIALMVVVFVLAVLLPFPRDKR